MSEWRSALTDHEKLLKRWKRAWVGHIKEMKWFYFLIVFTFVSIFCTVCHVEGKVASTVSADNKPACFRWFSPQFALIFKQISV